MKPVFSIVISICNAEKYLRNTLDLVETKASIVGYAPSENLFCKKAIKT